VSKFPTILKRIVRGVHKIVISRASQLSTAKDLKKKIKHGENWVKYALFQSRVL
jgi:hypothetical protein